MDNHEIREKMADILKHHEVESVQEFALVAIAETLLNISDQLTRIDRTINRAGMTLED